MDVRLRHIVESASALSPDEEKELLRIFQKNGCDCTFNTNGVFVNLSDAGPEALVDIERFLQFSVQKKLELDSYDQMRERMAAAAAAAAEDPADVANANANANSHVAEGFPAATTIAPPVVVSAMRKESMRFQALRKKYNRAMDTQCYTTPKLEREAY